ncbi:putative ATP-dependent RNA helicase DHX57 [Drosophila mojavensis]|uniref:Putative ATP-dependent RNA helicase DHX57 n=1 Tax=Drosophila mojavensis TaxID=7230 RepID=B4L6S3_DROMO|nr:putative ATP-dependent RNA helicase DHX57 [Drosophila mojavensis]EDW06069.1 uncharacterized protein Dmoj_GI16119, isoform A [Drosophila mojavensis]KRG07137.1 uncharacterized protein Dmoj_GI16119, isoform B [Drosophila mojavensis]
MDELSRQCMEDWHVRPPSDVRTTNVQAPPKSVPDNKSRKTELHVLRLSDESQQLTMDTLRAIHGPDFKLDDIAKYKDRGRGGKGIKHAYWEDRGTLQVQSVQGVSATSSSTADDDRLRRYALLKLENYGFHPAHCLEAYEHCSHDTEAALLLLYKRYMRVPANEILELEAHDEASLLDMRADEKEALQSIYDKAFEEREYNSVWNLKFKIEHLLAHSPSEVRKAREAVLAAAAAVRQAALDKKKKAPQRCRNFDRDGTCKFGPKCRFAHVPAQPEATGTPERKRADNLDENENEQWFHVEVRFPPGSRYPYEAPYIYLKTTCHDIPHELRLRFARRLYQEARQICRDGIPCIYSVCEMLQTDEGLAGSLDTARFPSPKHSLFYEEPTNGADQDANEGAAAKPRPSHYERGQTSRNDGGTYQRNAAALASMNRNLLKQFNDRRRESSYIKSIEGRRKLPAFAEIERIMALIRSNQVVVISGETGCGKSTQVPQFILDDWFFQACKSTSEDMPHVEIICTQPRRLSAIGVAERVAAERVDRIGRLVGYQIRLENKISESTRLTFCTTGILLRRLSSDPLLTNVSHVIVDEVHERSQDSDFLLLILKNILRERKDLKVILMSATLNASLFSNYFGGAPVLDIPGRTFPVEQLFLEDILDACDFVMECDTKFCRKLKKKDQEVLESVLEFADLQASSEPPGPKIKDENLTLAETYARYSDYSKTTCKSIYLMEPMMINPDLIESVLKYIVEGDHHWPREGSILIFLPGFQDIQAVLNALQDSAVGPRSGKYLLIPLHSALSSEDQALVFKRAPPGKRKIVLSTNIAETSVTIDDCVFVIDCGLMKEKGFDSNRNMESLDLVWVSRANAKQRKGRAGRVMPGVCIHLYTRYRYEHHILAQPVPEIQRVPLEQIVLRIKTLSMFASRNTLSVLLETLDAPKEDSVQGALMRLRDVGALDIDDQLTPLGHHLAALPVDVRIGKLMLYGAIFQCLDSVLTIAACLSNKSPFISPLNKRDEADKRKRQFALDHSDHLTVLNAYRKWLAVAKRGHYGASRNYASTNYLSINTLEMIADLKYQYLELLVSIGFVPVNVPRRRPNSSDNVLQLTGHEQNVNGENNRLLTSLLCAALYPNIVKIMTPDRVYIQTAGGAVPREPGHQDLRFKTRGDGYVRIHPSSVNSQVAVFQAPFLVYQEKVCTSSIYIRDCSMLPLIALVLFAGSDFKVELHDGDFLFLLESGWIIVKAHNHETAELIQCMRTELIKLLEEKIRDPCLNLLHHKNGCKIIANIVHLISNNY